MSLLSLIQAVCDRVGLTRPSVVVTSTDLQVRQLYALANEEGYELYKRSYWQSLTRQWTFITTASEEQTNTPIPDDLGRFVPDTFFDRTTRRKMIGPITPMEWQGVKAFPWLASPYIAFRERDGVFLVVPTPPAGDEIDYEYVTEDWAESNAGVGRSAFMADDDVARLDENLMALGIRWRWKQAKGLDYAEDMATYERNVSRISAADGGSGMINMGTRQLPPLLVANIPDGNYGL